MKTLHCSDAGFDCPGIIRANSEEEVLAQAVQHASDIHGVTITPELTEQLRTLVKDEA